MLFERTPLAIRIVALYLGTIVISLGSVYLYQSNQPVVYATENPVASVRQAIEVSEEAPVVIESAPTRLTVERLGIDLEVKPGYYDSFSKEWTIDNTSAFFATKSQKPGTSPGTTFIYGHNRKSAFGDLAKISTGDKVTLKLEDGHIATYEYARDVRVSPETTSIITEKSEYPQLVLMTCDGLFSDARRIMYFTLKEII